MRRLALFFALILVSCYGPQHHYDKFIKKGGKITCDTLTVNKVDTLFINGDTVIVNRPVTVIEKQVEYKTRWETKYAWKTKHDSTEVLKYQTKWKTKAYVKTVRTKERPHWGWYVLFYVLGFLSPLILYFIWVVRPAFKNMPLDDR